MDIIHSETCNLMHTFGYRFKPKAEKGVVFMWLAVRYGPAGFGGAVSPKIFNQCRAEKKAPSAFGVNDPIGHIRADFLVEQNSEASFASTVR